MASPSRHCALLLLLAALATAEQQKSELPPGYRAVRTTLAAEGARPEVSYLLLEPAMESHSRRPLLIHLYGAGGSMDFYNLASEPFREMRRLLAERRYFIVVPELGPGHWMRPAARAKLDRVVDDVLAKYPIQRKRIYMLGSSMGGGSSLAYAIHRPKLIRAICVHMGMTDFRLWYAEQARYQKQLADVFGGTPETSPAAYDEESAMAHLSLFRKIPLFLVYAEDDKVVLPAHGQRLYDAVRKEGGKATLRIAPGVAHKNESITPFQEQIVEFFDHAQ